MKLIPFLQAWEYFKAQKRQRERYQALIGREMNYAIIQDLIDGCELNTEIEVVLKDGNKFTIRRKSPVDRPTNNGEFY